MTRVVGTALYTPAILGLAVDLAEYPLDPALTLRGEAVSRLCGSRIELGISVCRDGRIERIGAQVTACAIGQAAAALFLYGARGLGEVGIARALDELEAWLDPAADAGSVAAPPTWPGLAVLAPARAHPTRHGAILLPWKAALEALSKQLRAA